METHSLGNNSRLGSIPIAGKPFSLAPGISKIPKAGDEDPLYSFLFWRGNSTVKRSDVTYPRAILQRLSQMGLAYLLAAGQVGNGARQFEDTVIGARG